MPAPAENATPPADTQLEQTRAAWDQARGQADLLTGLARSHGSAIVNSTIDHMTATAAAAQAALAQVDPLTMGRDLADYLKDMQERAVLFTDILRERGDASARREAEGLKPVLAFDYETILDGRQLPRPCNYALVRITPPQGSPATREDGRPWVIIDPRAGHGSGIGGFKAESEVGVALADGHPVYFVIFYPRPEPGQTLADVCEAEAEFLREVMRRHPGSPKPLVTGNCQGGWAAMILAATHTDLTGPVVIAGAPLSYWAGQVGHNPFRYYGGLAGGAVPALLSSDLGGGTFDGASLVQNFEGLNPGRNLFRKNYDLFNDVDTGGDRFLEFEKWWTGFYFMTEAEIRWIVENLFIGNKLTAGQAVLDNGVPVDLARITAPVVVFASHGDNITPPQQALHWIADLYETTEELRARGHVIVYTLHDSVGHLGIFVSARIANTRHRHINSVVKTIEALAPGLYEMKIEKDEDGFEIDLVSRQIDDIRAMGDGEDVEQEFAAVAELSDWAVKSYEIAMRPWIRAMLPPQVGHLTREMHPMRLQARSWSSQNPAVAAVSDHAQTVRQTRHAVDGGNPFKVMEMAAADAMERSLDLYRDSRDAMLELTFHTLYASPWARQLAPRRKSDPVRHDITRFPEVREVLRHIEDGGYPEAIVRMMVLMARARGGVRRERLERSNALLHGRAPFSSMTEEMRNHMIHEQSMIVDLAGKEAVAALPKLLKDDVDRLRAVNLVFEVAGPRNEMDAPTIAMFEQIQAALRIRARGWTNERAPEV
ncbi:DUF3141 domain-containing protein [Mameliella sediminis]|uniref:DUF3141 domain-containing protein n=1 Tax=Mameliella sediminis TaxID=2836866 RepID=UPI001C471266|nr:DUF3141 domain-containing protein [Mameliella sediminis]MBV7396282.1 DUF3141 domain-containing protein [Mameliella sediminis]